MHAAHLRRFLSVSCFALLVTGACTPSIGDEGEVDVMEVDELGEQADASEEDTTLIFHTGNLIPNGSFELGTADKPTFWGRGAGASVTATIDPYITSQHVQRTPNAAYSGGNGLRIRSSYGADPYAVAVNKIQAIPGRKYSVTARTRMRGGDQQEMHINVYDTQGLLVLTTRIKSGWSTEWHTIGRDVTAPANAAKIYVMLGDSGGSLYESQVDWDDVKIVAH